MTGARTQYYIIWAIMTKYTQKMTLASILQQMLCICQTMDIWIIYNGDSIHLSIILQLSKICYQGDKRQSEFSKHWTLNIKYDGGWSKVLGISFKQYLVILKIFVSWQVVIFCLTINFSVLHLNPREIVTQSKYFQIQCFEYC